MVAAAMLLWFALQKEAVTMLFVVHISNGGYSDAFVVHTANDSCDASVVNSEPIIHN